MPDYSQYIDRPGVFTCVVEKPNNGWIGEQGDNDTPFLRLPLRVTDQDDGRDDQDGKTIVYKAWLTEKAFHQTVKTLCEAFPSWNGDLDALLNEKFTFVGQECQIVCNSKSYNGKSRIEVSWLNPVGGGNGKVMDKAKIAGLISKLGRESMAIAKAVRAKSGVTASDSKLSQASADDDIPF